MKKLIFTCAMLVFASMVSFAQSNDNAKLNANNNSVQANDRIAQQELSNKRMAEQNADRQTKELQQKYSLTDEQYKKAYDANLVLSTKMIANRNPTNRVVTPADNQAILDERDAKLKTIMTEAQYSKYEVTRPMAVPRHPQPTTK